MKEENLEHLTEGQLLLMIGQQLAVQERGMLPKSREDLLKDAREWMEGHLSDFERMICSSEKVRKLAAESEGPTLASAIADLILGVCIGVSPVTVSYLLLKYGIFRLCKQEWESTS